MSKRTWRQIEDSRDRRLWITQVGLPVAGGIMLWMSDPERRDWTMRKAADMKKRAVKKVIDAKNAVVENVKGFINC